MGVEQDLTAEEIRVLACLVEKEATTPDNYPLSTNALVLACNQSTSRDPIVHYTERVIDAAMLSLRDQGLARTVRGDGQRVNKHRHVLRDAWSLSSAQLAVLSVLMLRGAQTAAELRARTDRYSADVESADEVLRSLRERDPPLVLQLERRPGEREVRWIHLLGDPAAIETARATAAVATDFDAPRGPSTADRVSALEEQVGSLTAEVRELQARLDALSNALGA